MPEKKTALTDPDNFVAVWDDKPEPEPDQRPKRAAKRTARKGS